MSLPYQKENIPRARALRKSMTRQERRLWYDCLRDMPMRFQRQKAIGKYIVDFYCHSVRLVVELDGGQHFETAGMQYDEKRSAYLTELGLDILRFTNLEVDGHFAAVCEKILQTLLKKAPSQRELAPP